MTPDEMIKSLTEPVVPLHPELERYCYESETFGMCIKHPMVFSMVHFPQQNAMVNAQLDYKLKARRKAMKAKDWHTYLFLHERPYRVDAFKRIKNRLSDEQYWDLLSDIWIDSENIRENSRVWERLLRDPRPGREWMMSDDDRLAFHTLPETIEVFQGHTDERHDGWSWTTNLATAEWFAHRFADLEQASPVVSYGTCSKDLVTAYLTGRNEAEILIDRRLVSIHGVKPLKPREGTFNDSRPVVCFSTGANSTTHTANVYLELNGTK
jgi:hypothetical protein